MKKLRILVLLLVVSLSFVSAQAPAKKPEPLPASPETAQIITKELLQKRLAELQQGREQAIANVNAFNGAISECEYWLNVMILAEAKPEPKAEKPKEKPP